MAMAMANVNEQQAEMDAMKAEMAEELEGADDESQSQADNASAGVAEDDQEEGQGEEDDDEEQGAAPEEQEEEEQQQEAEKDDAGVCAV